VASQAELFDDKAQYLEALEVHHKVMQAGMKTKQASLQLLVSLH
jgi:hypothetical protein